ncbi:MAG: 50S ribosomal protein L6, partial [Pseudomonadota bacterium]
FSKTLEINGVGYRAQMQGSNLQLQLGLSHEVLHPIPQDLDVKVTKPTEIIVTGIEKQRVGQFCAEVRSYRPPEPYKGKGIKYADEFIFRKEGKKK